MAYSAPRSLAPAAGFVSPALSQRAMLMAGIIGFHVLLAYALASGLGSAVLHRVLPDPIGILDIPDEPQTPPTPPPAPPPDWEMTRIDPVEPVGELNLPPSDDGAMLVSTTPEPPPIAPTPPVAKPDPIRLVGRNVLPNAEIYYPPVARREGVEGAANVQVCVDERGKRQGEPTITQSSGDARLDRGAIEVARDGRYARAMRGDTYVPNCYGFRVIFTMESRK